VSKDKVISDVQFIMLLVFGLFTVLRLAQEFFTSMETLPLPVKGRKILACARHPGPLSREGSLSCCDTGPRFFRSHPKDRPHSVASYDTRGDVENLF
jgi:hypothetical protein